MLDLLPFFSIHKYNAGGNDYWRQEEMFFSRSHSLSLSPFNVFDESENEAGKLRGH